MATSIIMPRQGQSVESCILTSWKVKEGDTVKSGQVVASIETDKATFDVESPGDGLVLARFFEEGADIPVLTSIAVLGQPGEDISQLRPGAGGTSVEATPQHSPSIMNVTAAPVASFAPVDPCAGISPRAVTPSRCHQTCRRLLHPDCPLLDAGGKHRLCAGTTPRAAGCRSRPCQPGRHLLHCRGEPNRGRWPGLWRRGVLQPAV